MMFTPLRRGRWGGWSASPKASRGQENGSAATVTNSRSSEGVILGRTKDATVAEATEFPPPQSTLEERDNEAVGGSVLSEDWKRFMESELLNERVLLRKDREALSERISALETERDECLYNMGLLLLEKKEWSPKNEELRQELIESQQFLKRQQEAHTIVVSELEMREQSLGKALGVEKQCVVDLEKALHEMRAEIAEIKFTSEKKLSDAQALEASLEQKKMEIEAKVHAADSRLAESNRKNSEMARKLDDLEARECKLQREFSSLNIERKALEGDVSKQREHLREWENELQEKQRRLLNEQRLLNEREERANEMDIILKKKHEEIGEERKEIDDASSILKSQGDDFKIRFRALTVKERDTIIKSSNLEKKEKDLMALEEKLTAREREEIQKLLDDHNANLDAKKQEFELEMVNKRRSFDEEVKNHMEILDKKKKEVRCKEEQLIKREEALENKTDELKNEEKNFDVKSKTLRNLEDSLKTNEKKLQDERNQLLKDSIEFEASRATLHKEKAAIEAERQKIVLEKENLKIAQEERELLLKLQAELKLKKEEYHMMMESLEKEKEMLRQDREMFEREWEVLDEKRVAFEADVKQLSAEREKFEKWRHNEEERLKNEGIQAITDIQRDLEDLRFKKEAFEKTMSHDKAEIHAEIDRKQAEITREFELLKHELEMNAQRRQDDADKKLNENEKEFEKWREVELSYIKSSRESNEFNQKKLEMQQNQLQREKEEFSVQRTKFEVDRHEIQNDIDTLLRLSKTLKDQREGFAKEKEMFLSAVEKCKNCHNCGVPIDKIDLDLLRMRDTEDSEEILLPSLADGFLEENLKGSTVVMTPGGPVMGSTNSGSQVSRWFKKCANLFKISPQKNVHSPTGDESETSFRERLDRATFEENADYKPAPSVVRSFENQIYLDSGNEVGEPDRVDRTGEEAEASLGVADSSIDVDRIHRDNVTKVSVVVIDDDNNEMQGSSMHVENDLQSKPANQGQRLQPNRRAKLKLIRRTHSVKAVVEDAKAFLGESSELKIDKNGDANQSESIPEESQGALVQARAVTQRRRKRLLSEQEPEGSEENSENIFIGGRHKRRQTSSVLPAPGDKRYNLRRSTVASTSAASKATSHQEQETNAERISYDDPQPSVGFESSVNSLEKSAAVPNILEVDSEKMVQNVESARSIELSAADGVELDEAASADTKNTASEDDDDEEDDDAEEKRTASIGKKLWHFLTT
ncbi:hypothetical protein KSP39_PZI023586 [Platanthera zijinensis]|uniref:Nuclear matrix constituent protein 1-like protein n=1 Tax=Platanthera zijinensis TaxID=2320716 RepID=A0AAP0AT14_9ASPA